MNVQTWTPPRSGLKTKDLPLWNLAMSYMGAPLPLEGTGASLRLSPIAAPHLTGPLHELKSAEGQTVYAHIDAFPYQQLLGVDFDLDAAGDLPADLMDAIYAGSTEFLLHRFPDTLTAGMTYQASQADALVQADDLKWFAAALDGLAETPVFFSVGATADDICAFLKDKLDRPGSVLTVLRDTLDVALHRVIGRARLELGAVRDLEPGDFIVLEDAVTGDLEIRCEDRAFYFETHEDGWLCKAIRPIENIRKMPAMDDTLNDPHPAERPTQDDATLPEMAALASTVLTFECGTTRMTLAALEALQTGAIVPLPDQLIEDGIQVTVRAGDHPIAMGDVVQIDDRLAVRVNRLLTRTL